MGRCTRCKEHSEIRHKYHGGVYCESCIKEIRGFKPKHTRGLFGWLHDFLVTVGEKLFKRKTKRVELNLKPIMSVRTLRKTSKEMPRHMFRHVQHKA